MEIEHSTKNNVLIIHFNGDRLDVKDTPRCKQEILDLINEKQMYQVVFDLSKILFIDSSGISIFLAILRHLNSRDGELKLSAITQPVRTVIELISIDKVFEIYNTPEEAAKSFGSLSSTKE